MPDERSDAQRRELLAELDGSLIEVSEWEAKFIDSVLKQSYPWTLRQIAVIDRILDEKLPF
jgi:hypothetical protein